MNRVLTDLILYSNIEKDSVIANLKAAFEQTDGNKAAVASHFNAAIRQIICTAEQFGLSGNVWQQYLTKLFLYDENPFTLKAERNTVKKSETISEFAVNDYAVLKQLFDFDFTPVEKMLGSKIFSKLYKYKSSEKKKPAADYESGIYVKEIAAKIAETENAKEIFKIMTDFYREHGTGVYGTNTAFRIVGKDTLGNSIEIIPVCEDKSIRLDDLVGLEIQKKQLRANTGAFCRGKRSNDVLLYGDNGTGKSTSIKALLNEYAGSGLRLVEVNKYQFQYLPELIAKIEDRNYKFIIFIDDLSFEEDEIEYKFLKSVIEGGIENRPANILIYATSNRRHLIKEMWDDRKDMEYNGEIHHSDTIEEKISLSSRFGVSINFSKPDKREYERIVLALAEKEGITMDEKTLLLEADRWELRHGGFTGRVARQFINHIAGLEEPKC